MGITDDDVKQAEAAMQRLQQSTATAVSAHYDRRIGRVVVRLSSGLEVAFSPHDAEGLQTAKSADLDAIEISPSGLGIHFPKLDADLYVPALLEGLLGSRKWMAERLGAAPGKSRSEAKAEAKRSSSKRGGGPAKAASSR